MTDHRAETVRAGLERDETTFCVFIDRLLQDTDNQQQRGPSRSSVEIRCSERSSTAASVSASSLFRLSLCRVGRVRALPISLSCSPTLSHLARILSLSFLLEVCRSCAGSKEVGQSSISAFQTQRIQTLASDTSFARAKGRLLCSGLSTGTGSLESASSCRRYIYVQFPLFKKGGFTNALATVMLQK